MISQMERRRRCMRIVANDTIDLLSDCECVAVAVAAVPGHLIQETCVTSFGGQPQPETERPQTSPEVGVLQQRCESPRPEQRRT